MAAYNVQSLFIFFAIISLLGGGVASLCFKRLDTSAKYWTVATVLWGITGMLTVFRNELPPLWSYSIPIGVNSASFILMGLGIVRLYKQGPQWPSLLALSLATVVYTVTMELCRLHAGPKVTLVLSGLAFGLSSIWCAYPAHVHFKLTRNRFSMHMRWVMAGLGLLHLVRMQGALTGWGVETFGQDTWTLGIWSAIFVFGIMRYFTYVAMRIQEQSDASIKVAAALAREEEGRRLGSQLAQLERQQSLGVMSASFAHELNQPLSVILNYAELLQHQQRSGTMEPTMTLTVLDDIIASSLRATEIIRRIRRFIKPRQNPKNERFDLRTVVQDVLALISPEGMRSAITVVTLHMPEPFWVRADPVLMSQVLFNVLRNAMESMLNSAERHIHLDISQNTTEVNVTVTDSGTGLSENDIHKVGTPFYTTKPTGMGLGLSISMSILAQYGGHLSLTNTGHGTRVSICLPQADAIESDSICGAASN
jgi:signal transduction histidine kinase